MLIAVLLATPVHTGHGRKGRSRKEKSQEDPLKFSWDPIKSSTF
eukprot:SAG31_NODE_30702_length_377_cov_0.802158_1_plen_43_part_10